MGHGMSHSLPHPIGHVNWLGTWTLYKKEVWRFMKVWNQTIVAPVVTTLLFLAIFTLALGDSHRMVEGMEFTRFIAPGLIMMAIVQNAFANSSSSLMLSKVQGVIVDLLMPPFAPGEITFAYVMAGLTRGFLVGISVWVALAFFADTHVVHPFYALFIIIMASTMMALCGVLTGLWSQTFDQLSAITNYVVAPLSFLSGTFYSVKALPGVWYTISQFNPFFYMIDGFRYAMTDYSCGNVQIGMWVLLGVNITLWCVTHYLIKTGYRLKS